MGENIAIVVMSFKRHQLLKWCIQCLERNIGIENYDFIILQDGAVNDRSRERKSEDEDIMESLRIARDCSLPNKRTVFQYYNIGMVRMRDYIFSLYDEGYDFIIQIENGVMFGRFALHITEIMSRQFKNCVITPYSAHPISDIREYEDRLYDMEKENYSHMYCFGMWDKTFRKIEDDWRGYSDICELHDYDNLPEDLLRRHYGSTDSRDVIVNLLIDSGVDIIRPSVSRAKYYGYNTPSINTSWGNEGPAEFDCDYEIGSFNLV